jgi:hypothetical protein
MLWYLFLSATGRGGSERALMMPQLLLSLILSKRERGLKPAAEKADTRTVAGEERRLT